LEIFRNFQTAMESSGFQIRFQCEQSQRCGDASGFVSAVAGTGTIGSLSNGNSYHNLMVDTLWPIGDNIHAATMHLARPQGDVDAFVLVVGNANQPAGVLLQIVEAKAMATGQVTVDAKAMSQGLAQNGHIALYGIHFASDSAVLGKDSAATLAEMAKLLKAQPALKVYIVGHTDDSGSLAHNLALSQQRAEAVVKALETQYGIAPARLAAKGLASYAPVASNRDDAGKARNRRVELVEQ
jgi:outer membrane protein OmpA-like peptidoglycan-associated protein